MHVLPASIPVLVQRSISGDQKAYAQLYNAHVDQLFRFMLQFAENRDQTMELVQTAFVKAFLNLDKFSGKASFKTWLFQIAINEMKMDVRSVRSLQESFNEEVHTRESTETMLLTSDLKIWINRLDARQKLVLLLIEAEGYSHAEAAALLGISESGSRTLLTRAKMKLKQFIQKDGSYGTT